MNKAIVIGGVAGALAAAAAVAHPTDVAYDSRGECEAAYAESSKEDRERLVANGIFPTIGAAQSTFRDRFVCEYDEDAKAWFIVDHWQAS